MKTPNGYEVIELFEQFSPKAYAMDGDPIGLQAGRLNKPVSKVLVALDVLETVVDEAIEAGAGLIIAHHPLIYRPLKRIDLGAPEGRILEKLIKHEIAVYAAHTNLDVAWGGVNDLLADALGLQETEVLSPTHETTLKKLVTYVPEENAEAVREALGNAGAGAIGHYSSCSFSVEGTGMFLPEQGSNPVIGSKGTLERVKEVRIEVIYPETIEKKLLSVLFKAHPYEEPAYDLFTLDNKGESLGLGRVGMLKEEMTLGEFAEHVKRVLEVPALRVVGNLNAIVKKAAVLGGDGNKYFQSAIYKGADVYVTGDMYYHTALDARSLGLNIIDPGHNVEKVMKKGVAAEMTKRCEEKKFLVEFIPSTIHTDPFTFM